MTPDERRTPSTGARTRRRREQRGSNRRSLGLTLLAVVPGAGLTRTRYRALGWSLLGLLAAAVVAVAALVFVRGPRALLSSALKVAVDPTLLGVTAAVIALVGLVWVGTIVLTHVATQQPHTDTLARLGMRLFTAALCVLVVLPLAKAVSYVGIQRDVISTVASGTTIRKSTSTATPQVAAEDPWAKTPRVNMLLIGSDAGNDRIGLRTDSMVIASTDTKTGATVLISLPRNLERVPFPKSNPLHQIFPDGYHCPERGVGNECMLNATWQEALDHKALFGSDPNPGLTTIRGVLEEITGLTMDDTTIIDLAGFESLVDAMGGVKVNNTERLPINGYHTSSGGVAGIEGWIEPGSQRLNGHQALWYARSRLLSDDYSRMRRQRCLIGAIVNQVNPATMLGKYPELAQVAKDNIKTDVSIGDLPAWVDLVQRIQKGGIRSLTFTYDVVNVARPDFDKMRKLVQDAINPPAPVTPPTTAPTKPTTPPTTSTVSPTRPPDSETAVDVKAAC